MSIHYPTFGEAAMRAGSPDYLSNDIRENAIDTIANILHAYHRAGHEDLTDVLDAALMHVTAELAGDDS